MGLALLTVCAGVWLAFNQRIWPFDEEGNLGASRLLAERGLGAFFAQYPDLPWLGRQHPPLAILINGLVMWVFGPELAYIRLVTLAYTVAAVGLVFWLGQLLYDRLTGLVAACFLVAFPLVLRVGTVAMTDVQVMTYALLKGEDMKLSARLLMLTGSISMMVQTPLGQSVVAMVGT